uniref:Uncharacterized protein n=1 Tax=Cryptomonas curvata TaxID=233186 RepID=A0A7S0MIF4_9CRYP|mmetsp:Transcript_43002/g.89964  ORF Transcript_43002/g.89964 Transcript_43002/m.89964 type:complete len:183 (+) Transcript_43002:7-555(+)
MTILRRRLLTAIACISALPLQTVAFHTPSIPMAYRSVPSEMKPMRTAMFLRGGGSGGVRGMSAGLTPEFLMGTLAPLCGNILGWLIANFVGLKSWYTLRIVKNMPGLILLPGSITLPKTPTFYFELSHRKHTTSSKPLRLHFPVRHPPPLSDRFSSPPPALLTHNPGLLQGTSCSSRRCRRC